MPVLTVGLGGVWTEAFGDVAVVPLPADAARVERALRSLRAAPLLAGTRTGAPADVAAAAALAARAGALLLDQGLELLELNPVLVNARGAVAVDACRSERGDPEMNDIAAQLGEVGLPAPLSELAAREWDAVVVGGGHNGLTAAAYLARAGQQRARARAPRAARRRLHARAAVRRRALRRQPVRLRRRACSTSS